MRKSRGNLLPLRDLLAKGHEPAAIRYLLLSAHYRTNLNFTESGLAAAAESVKRLRDCAGMLSAAQGPGGESEAAAACAELRQRFEAAMDDDLNVPEALAALFAFVSAVHGLSLGGAGARKAFAAFMDVDSVLGLGLREVAVKKEAMASDTIQLTESARHILWQGVEPTEEVKALVQQREFHRQAKKWAEADSVREKLRKRGLALEDRDDGVVVKKA